MAGLRCCFAIKRTLHARKTNINIMARVLTTPLRLEAKARVAELYAEGRSSRYIAANIVLDGGVTISATTVLTLINEILKDLKATYKDKVDELFWANLDKYNRMEAKMWDAWDLSCQQRTKRTSRRKGTPVINPTNNTVRSVKTNEVNDSEEFVDGRGDPRYATIILDCIDRRMQWLGKLKFGVEAVTPQVINNTNNNVTLVIRPAERVRSPKMLQLEAEQAKIQQLGNDEVQIQ